MNFISLDEFKNTDEYNDFISNNPSVGTLKVQAFTAFEAIPVSDTQILITKQIGDNNVLFFNGMTNSSGVIDDITLPAPKPVEFITADDYPAYTLYTLNAYHDGYEPIKTYEIGMFGDIKILQYVKMTPEVTLKGVNTDD